MMSRKPPRFAEWLLRRSGIASSNEPLHGDLLEEFGDGRSSFWFWKQTLAALARCVSFAPNLTVAYIAGWLAQLCLATPLWYYHWPSRLVSAGAGIGLMFLRLRGRRYLVGDNFSWSDVPGLLKDGRGPFRWRSIPLWMLVAADEGADLLETYLLMSAAIGPFEGPLFLFCEISWLLTHAVARRAANRRRGRLKKAS